MCRRVRGLCARAAYLLRLSIVQLAFHICAHTMYIYSLIYWNNAYVYTFNRTKKKPPHRFIDIFITICRQLQCVLVKVIFFIPSLPYASPDFLVRLFFLFFFGSNVANNKISARAILIYLHFIRRTPLRWQSGIAVRCVRAETTRARGYHTFLLDFYYIYPETI